ncbi:unnamed protein product [Protopolystoma xenopodis]|uniref:Uncharacterized protein n=1 Tax=Protopolystoma xenopodis TaxID=117903 RepID=A0A3S5FFR1_9PLAT|nr:unnamed protein product [Protopolystoma xenopodis]
MEKRCRAYARLPISTSIANGHIPSIQTSAPLSSAHGNSSCNLASSPSGVQVLSGDQMNILGSSVSQIPPPPSTCRACVFGWRDEEAGLISHDHAMHTSFVSTQWPRQTDLRLDKAVRSACVKSLGVEVILSENIRLGHIMQLIYK